MIKSVEVELEGVKLEVTVNVYGDRVMSPDAWWHETAIKVADPKDNLVALLQEFSSDNPWHAYDRLMDRVDELLIERG